MGKLNIGEVFRDFVDGCKEHSPEIGIGIGIAGSIIALGLAIKATPKAIVKIETRKSELNAKKLPPKEMIKTAAPSYIPTVITEGLAIACIVAGARESLGRTAALSAAYQLSEATVVSYKNKIREYLDEERAAKLNEEVSKERAIASKDIHDKKHGEVDYALANDTKMYSIDDELFFDVFSQRPFMSTVTKLEHAANVTYQNMLTDAAYGEATVNEFYGEAGIKQCPLGEYAEFRLEDGPIEVYCPENNYITINGKPHRVFEFRQNPRMRIR